MKKYFKTDVLKWCLGGLGIFGLGIFLGHQVNYGSITSIQGYLFNSVGEAINQNATDGNATDGNATSADLNDGYIYLDDIDLEKSKGYVGDKIKVYFSTYGARIYQASILFKNYFDELYTVNVNFDEDVPYFIVPSNMTADCSYYIYAVDLFAENSDCSTFYEEINVASQLDYGIYFQLLNKTSNSDNNNNSNSTVDTNKTNNTDTTSKENTTPSTVELQSIKLESTSAKSGDTVYLNVKTNTTLTNLRLTFENENSNSFNVYVRGLTEKPFFVVPSNSEIGEYSLVEAKLTTADGTVIYNKTGDKNNASIKTFKFNSKLEILNNNDKVYIYNNESLNSKTIAEIFDTKSDAEITISANDNTIISSDLFKALKGTNRKLIIYNNDNQIIFNGDDIKEIKAIDVKTTLSTIEKKSEIGKLVDDGVVLTFSNNGSLPGKATIKIKKTSTLKDLNKNVYVYFYNKENNNFSLIAKNVKLNEDGYYVFEISHNSEYIMVNKQLDSSLIATNNNDADDKVVTFQKSNKVYIILIALGLIIALSVAIFLVIVKKKKKNKKNLENNNQN